MKFEWLTSPCESDPPCGPDLEAGDDAAFVDYYYEAEGRLPERYFTPGLAPDGSEDRLFDPRSVDFTREGRQISELLQRSRDLRLTGLLARFAILSGRLSDFADAVEQSAMLMEVWPIETHPRADGSAADRRAAIEVLNTQPTVIMPLLHLSLLPSGDVTLRRHMVASGRADARASEGGLDTSTDVLEPMRGDAVRPHLARVQDDLSRIAEALHRIASLARSHPSAPFSPDLTAVRTAISDMQAMISTARPDLPGWSEDRSAAPVADLPDAASPAPVAAGGAAPVQLGASPAPAPMPADVPRIADRAAALAALHKAEDWLAAREPSSPSLLLVTQARLLVGAPLVQALEALLPGEAGKAVLNIGQGSPFALPMERLKSLSTTGLENRPETAGASVRDPVEIDDRRGLTACLIGIEAYYAAHEPASPVPLLLAKARDMLTKRFDAIVAELIVTPLPQGS
ncbi:MAG: ImpA family type VI secretion system protein [Paracoccus sp. (in: a-proteobacteria)]